MEIKADKSVKPTTWFLSMLFALAVISCGVEAAKDNNEYLGKLPTIYQKHIQELSDLKAKHREAKTEEEKDNIMGEGKHKYEEFNTAISDFNQSTPLTGNKLPFKVIGSLPFDVQNVKITNVDADSVDFIIQVKINQDIRKDNGELSQRLTIYYAAFDTKGNNIPDTDNYGTNHGWIELAAKTKYEAQGHWNAERVQNMGDFDFIGIMSKAEYQNIQ